MLILIEPEFKYSVDKNYTGEYPVHFPIPFGQAMEIGAIIFFINCLQSFTSALCIYSGE